jgi:hypothetical protein
MERGKYYNVQVRDPYCYLASLFAILHNNRGSCSAICTGFGFGDAHAADDILPIQAQQD